MCTKTNKTTATKFNKLHVYILSQQKTKMKFFLFSKRLSSKAYFKKPSIQGIWVGKSNTQSLRYTFIKLHIFKITLI